MRSRRPTPRLAVTRVTGSFYASKDFSGVSPGRNLFVTQNTGSLNKILTVGATAQFWTHSHGVARRPHAAEPELRGQVEECWTHHRQHVPSVLEFPHQAQVRPRQLQASVPRAVTSRHSAAVLSFQREHFSVLDSTDAIKVGIHVRYGDGNAAGGTFSGDFHDPVKGMATVQRNWNAYFQPFFDAAEQITQMALGEQKNRKVVWLVLSDLAPVRQIAKARWPDRVVTREGNRCERPLERHSLGHATHNSCAGWVDHAQAPRHGAASIQAAFGELTTLAKCDHFVVRGLAPGASSLADSVLFPIRR